MFVKTGALNAARPQELLTTSTRNADQFGT
jgi:hypothetical protein